MKGPDRLEVQQAVGGSRDAAAVIPSVEPCQHGGVAKGFKGRGEHRPVTQAQRKVDRVHTEMDQLVQEAKDFAFRTGQRLLDLALHRRAGTQQHSLRWREPGSGGRHVGWEEVPNHLAGCSVHLLEWYSAFTRRARALNAQEKLCRADLRRARLARDVSKG